jgi:hypothetical protein
MDPPSRWDKPLQFASAVTALNRGGIQKEDAAYNPKTRVSQPSGPPPANLYPQQHQPTHGFHHGQNTSYFAGHPASPFQNSTQYSPPPQQGSPPQQSHSPSSHSNSQSQSNSQPRYNPNINQGQGSPPLGEYMHQGSTYGGGIYTEPVADYHSTASASSPHHQESFDSGYTAAGDYSIYDNSHQGHNNFYSQEQYSLQRSATQDPATFNYQYGQSYENPSTYNSSLPISFELGPRSYTVPVGHDCSQSWNRYAFLP